MQSCPCLSSPVTDLSGGTHGPARNAVEGSKISHPVTQVLPDFKYRAPSRCPSGSPPLLFPEGELRLTDHPGTPGVCSCPNPHPAPPTPPQNTIWGFMFWLQWLVSVVIAMAFQFQGPAFCFFCGPTMNLLWSLALSALCFSPLHSIPRGFRNSCPLSYPG